MSDAFQTGDKVRLTLDGKIVKPAYAKMLGFGLDSWLEVQDSSGTHHLIYTEGSDVDILSLERNPKPGATPEAGDVWRVDNCYYHAMRSYGTLYLRPEDTRYGDSVACDAFQEIYPNAELVFRVER